MTEKGELIYLFPSGFTKPWVTEEFATRTLRSIGRGLAGVGRFVVRAWLTVVIVAYALVFVALLIGLSAAGSSDRDDRGGGLGSLAGAFLRFIADAIFWTFHPFSPLSDVGYYAVTSQGYRRQQADRPGTAFYEKVNRFFFGPPPGPEEDERVMERRIIEEIRLKQGRIGLADVMRVTGLERHKADPLMARLMLDYEGDVFVADDGGIAYRFPEIRRTADAQPHRAAGSAAWDRAPVMPPLTGNSLGANVGIFMLNGFNILMSTVALSNHLTIERVRHLFDKVPHHHYPVVVPTGTPIVLGIIPLVFSLAILAIPLGRAILRPIKRAQVAREKGRLAVLKEVLTHIDQKRPVEEEALTRAYTRAAGREPGPKEVQKRVVALGADVDEQGRYRFPDLELEAQALEEEREQAEAEEARPGKVVFSSES